MIKNNKIKIIAMLIISIICNSFVPIYAGQWLQDKNDWYYFYDEKTYATGWRWIDVNNDNVAECYRFLPNGKLVTSTVSNGKEVNKDGQWVIDGEVQKLFINTGVPVGRDLTSMIKKSEEAEIEYEEYYEYVYDIATKSTASNASPSNASPSNATPSRVKKLRRVTPSNVSKRIDSTGRDVFNLYKQLDEKDSKNKSKNSNKTPKGDPRAVFSPSNTGYIISNRASINKPKPEGGDNSNKTIDTTIEDEPKYLTDEDVKLLGKDMTELVTASNKFTKSVQNVKVYGGDVWPEAMQLSGNEASVKFNVEKYNWFRFEVAHQTHGESTKDTYAYLELYIGSDQVAVYDSFNDDEPEIVEEWIDDADKTITLKLVVEGDAKGRKVYIREARARKLKED